MPPDRYHHRHSLDSIWTAVQNMLGAMLGVRTPGFMAGFAIYHLALWLFTKLSIITKLQFQFSSVQFSHSVMSNSLRPHESQHTKPPSPSRTPGVHSNSYPLSRWCHPAISSSVVPFSSCPQSLPASESLPMSQLFAWGGQSTGVSALASFLPKKSQGWSPLEWTGWISLQSKGLSRVFFNTTVQKHQFMPYNLRNIKNIILFIDWQFLNYCSLITIEYTVHFKCLPSFKKKERF